MFVGREFRATPLGLCFVGWGREPRPMAWADIGPPHSGFRNFRAPFVLVVGRWSFGVIVRVRWCLAFVDVCSARFLARYRCGIDADGCSMWASNGRIVRRCRCRSLILFGCRRHAGQRCSHMVVRRHHWVAISAPVDNRVKMRSRTNTRSNVVHRRSDVATRQPDVSPGHRPGYRPPK